MSQHLSDPATGDGVDGANRGGHVVIGDHPDAQRRVADLLEIVEIVRPVIAADGGELDLVSVDVAEGIVTMRLSGACGSCAISGATLNQGIDRILRDRLDWVTEVIGQVEESEISGFGGWTPKHS
jgi:Fe-S cluster biogenesis protein NfuA